MKKSNEKNVTRQAGATLVVALVLLLLVSILGAAGIRTATVEERMAASARNKDIALQAAEAAISSAESYLDTLANTSGFDATCSNGLCSRLSSASAGERWEDATLCSNSGIWQCGAVTINSGPFTGSDSLYALPPQYFIELLTNYEPLGDNMNMYNYGSEISNTQFTVFRITAVGYGGTTDARVMLQSTYARKL